MPDPFLETNALGLRSEGGDAVRAAYAMQFFSAFPDLAPADEGMAFADDAIVGGARSAVSSSGGSARSARRRRHVRRAFCQRGALFRDGLMAGEIIYFDLATLCEQAGIPLEDGSSGRGGAKILSAH